MPFYLMHEMTHAALSPFRAAADMTRLYFQNPLNPLSQTPLGRSAAAGCEVFERATRQYGKPQFGLDQTVVAGTTLDVREEVVWSNTFCNLIHFERMAPAGRAPDMTGRMTKVVIVAPMSGHYATLLRGTVEGLLPYHDVYITDWVDARQVPMTEGRFDLDDYIDYVVSISHFFQGDVHFLAVCQPSVPVLAAVALMEENKDPYAPKSMTLMGGPIDTRINPTVVNDLASRNDLDWFKSNVILTVPFPHPGIGRSVYPGFLQLSGFMSMNLDRHVTAHKEYYNHLVEGDGDSAEKHREFYDEYLAVMDLTAEFYLQTVDTVFIRHALPNREMMHRGQLVNTSAIEHVALFTVEGEKDDISGVGQTEAAHTLCDNLSDDLRAHYVQPSVGHYGVFNGSRFLSGIRPRITDFVNTIDERKRSGVTKKVPSEQSVTSEAADIAMKDDLTAIAGVGPKLAELLNKEGILTFKQMASLSDDQLQDLDQRLSFKGRAQRDDWIGQAKKLAMVH